ncbi:hypothetical protein GCM10009609_66750 [Pseudonocardia aurantiaca]|uniref:Uncharacterized protein n=1 Tax=Pseudonocardia aurantiaca TaxID=75290 RepID=A0ABW4FQ29_9PSEU
MTEHADDSALRALDELRLEVDNTIRDLHGVKERLEQLTSAHAAGAPWSEIVAKQDRPLVVEMITSVLSQLGETGSRFRREQALALRREDLSITRISELFGVSRQRISTILRERPPPVAGAALADGGAL